MVTDKWETLSEIKERTGAQAEAVIDAVRDAYFAGHAVLRFDERAGVKVAEWRQKTQERGLV